MPELETQIVTAAREWHEALEDEADYARKHQETGFDKYEFAAITARKYKAHVRLFELTGQP